MHYFEYATKDTTLYEVSKSMNTGLDEILEIRKDMNDDGSVINVTRALIKFDLTYISESIVDGLISNPTYYLNLYDANSTGLNVSQKLYAYPVSQSWDMGSGKAQSNPIIEDGASWKYKDNKTDATPWYSTYNSVLGVNKSTGSFTLSGILGGGEDVFTLTNSSGTKYYFAPSATGETDTSDANYYYFATGSSLTVSTQNLSNEINSITDVGVSASSAAAVLSVTASDAGTGGNSITFTSGSTTLTLAGGTDTTQTLSGGGGTWYSGSTGQYSLEASQSFTHEPKDVRMDVTGIVNNWIYSGSSYANEGFMLKRSGSMGNSDSNVEEGNTTQYGNFIFFGRDTNTIYQPKLEVVWDDSKWATGSLNPLTSANLEDMVLYMRGLRPEYKEKSKVKFRVIGRERYPEKSYSTSGYSTGYTTAKYLPSGSTYYQIKDAYTEEIIVPFGSGSIVSCDSTGNYFNVWLNGLQAERFYRIEYKVVSGSGTIDETVEFYDEKHSFKVVR